MIRVNQIKVQIKHSIDDVLIQAAKHLRINKEDIIAYEIVKKSIDARDKSAIKYVYSIDIKVPKQIEQRYSDDKLKSKLNIAMVMKNEYTYRVTGEKKTDKQIVIVGAGPAGLFCALKLCEYGYKTLIVERGESVEDRTKTVDRFFVDNLLNEESNIQFGEGGAGTFSDGKLNTLINDKMYRHKEVLKTFVKYGAKDEILYINKPHIGTDVLKNVVINIRKEIIKLGGNIRFNTKMTDILVESGEVRGIQVNNDEIIECDALVLAIGHSARDTFYMIKDKGLALESKDFAVGVRIEHKADSINEAMYGNKYKNQLPAADYKLTYRSNENRGVYSFCMCPGGYVVNASSEKEKVCVNGMSYSKRDAVNSNSAIVVTVTQNDFNSKDIFAGLEFQRVLEQKAFIAGKSYVPVQRYADYKNNQMSTYLGNIEPSVKNYMLSDINSVFSNSINKALKEGIEYFGHKIKGYNDDDSIVLGVESRTSSPIRILRDDEFVSNINGIYPCGEGAGYAGGITSAAIDGIKVFEHIASVYCS